MKALQRITRYGLKKYLMSSRKIKMTQEHVDDYQNRYGQDIPLDKVVRYRQTFWHIKMERDDETWEGNYPSYLHQIPVDERDREEAFRNAQADAGETGWVLTFAKKIGYLKPVYHGEGKWVETRLSMGDEIGKDISHKVTEQILPIVEEKIVETHQQKRDSIALSLKRAGYSASEVVKALMEVK